MRKIEEKWCQPCWFHAQPPNQPEYRWPFVHLPNCWWRKEKKRTKWMGPVLSLGVNFNGKLIGGFFRSFFVIGNKCVMNVNEKVMQFIESRQISPKWCNLSHRNLQMYILGEGSSSHAHLQVDHLNVQQRFQGLWFRSSFFFRCIDFYIIRCILLPIKSIGENVIKQWLKSCFWLNCAI